MLVAACCTSLRQVGFWTLRHFPKSYVATVIPTKMTGHGRAVLVPADARYISDLIHAPQTMAPFAGLVHSSRLRAAMD